ncbi:MAG: hypothetical protein KF841_11180 [Phycisphaerae bacterium]|nr:hypothetical protein [Phycisphaerae bacterium]
MSRSSKSNFHFVLGFSVLLAATVSIQAAKSRGWLYIIKKPLSILKPLSDMNRSALAPYGVVEMAPLSPELIQELGTTEYLNWILREPGVRSRSNQDVTLSITYYTNVQDQVPHVPEECYFQSGNFTAAGDTSMMFHCVSLGADVAVRRLAFYRAGEMVKKSYVYYTICVNGEFCSDRTTVRTHMANPFDTHLYYSKVEIAFDQTLPKNEPELDEKARQLFDKVLPELVKAHWPPKGSERGGMLPAP